jgi:hypothetical protein
MLDPCDATFAAFLLVLPGCQWTAADFLARVVGIADGVALTMLTADCRQVEVQPHWIDAPESRQNLSTRRQAGGFRAGL